MNILRIQGLTLRTNEAVRGKKLKNCQSQLKMYWFFLEVKSGLQ